MPADLGIKKKAILSDHHVAAIDALVTNARMQRKNRGLEWVRSHRNEILAGVIGLFLTFVMFAGVSFFAHNIIRGEHDRVSQNLASFVAKNLQNVVQTMNSSASLFSIRDDLDWSQLQGHLQKSGENFQLFNKLFYINETEAGRYNRRLVYRNTQAGERSVNENMGELENSAIRQILSGGEAFSLDEPVIFNKAFGESSYRQTIGNLTITSRPIMVYRAIEKNSARQGVLVGFFDIAEIVKNNWSKDTQYIRQLVVRESETGRVFYSLFRQDARADQQSSARQDFVFPAAGLEWQIRVDFFKAQKFVWLELMSYAVLVLGLAMTILAVFLMYTFRAREKDAAKARQALDSKDFEMEIERSERERISNMLRASENEHKAIINAISDIIFETDTDGNICFISTAWEKVTGFNADNVLQKDLFDFLHSDDAPVQRENFKALIKGQKEPYRETARLRCQDGTFRSVELAFSMMRQNDKKNMRVVGTFTDIEEHRRAERALQETEKKYRTIVEHSAIGIYQMTPEGMYLSANPAMAKMLGFEKPETMLREIRNANDSVYVNKTERMRFVHQLLQERAIQNHEVQMRRQDGSVIWVNENVRCVSDDAGNILYHEGSIEDITQRKSTEKEIVDAKIQSDMANRAKTEFLANMSHELRTPLNSIIGFSEMIKDEVLGKIEPNDYWEYAKDIHESGKGLLNIINEILDISRIEARERELNDTLVNVDKIVSSCLDLIGSRFEAKKIKVQKELDGMPRLVAEERALKQIFMNLLSNAMKYTPENGRVNISYQVDQKGQLRISITDTGIGLTEQEIEKALSPFGQIDNELSRSGSGTGLGLTLVDSLVKLHAGKLEMISQKGVGTSVTIVMPVERVMMQADED